MPAVPGFLAPSRAISTRDLRDWVCRAALATLGDVRRGGGPQHLCVVAQWQGKHAPVRPNRAAARRWPGGFLSLALVLAALTVRVALGQQSDEDVVGAYAVTIAAEDVPPELIGGASLIGRWHIEFSDDGAYMLARQDVGPLVRGALEVTGKRLTLRDESGVIACEPGPEGDAATYEWNLTGNRLLLTAVEEECDRRRLLLTTRTLSVLVPCPTPALERQAIAIPEAPATPMALGSATPSFPSPDEAIDTLLKQMSDCWATRQPERFLPLLSQRHRAEQRPVGGDAERRFVLNMGAPVVWELAGDVEITDGAHATAMVRQTLGDSVDVVRYAFVLEDGSWLWDGVADSP